MKDDPLPDGDHVLRYAGGATIDAGTVTGTAFLWTKTSPDDVGLSVNWMEKFDGTIEERVQRIRDLSRLTYGATAKLARLNVGRVKAYVRAEAPDTVLDMVEDPLPANDAHPEDPSHSAITSLPDKDTPAAEMIGDLIAECIEQTFPARIPNP